MGLGWALLFLSAVAWLTWALFKKRTPFARPIAFALTCCYIIYLIFLIPLGWLLAVTVLGWVAAFRRRAGGYDGLIILLMAFTGVTLIKIVTLWSWLWWMAVGVVCFKAVGWVIHTWNTMDEAGEEEEEVPRAKHRRSGQSGGQSGGGGASGGGRAADSDHETAEERDARRYFGDGVRLKELHVTGATGEIARILKARDYYAVLDVPREAEGTEIKKAYRMKQLATHPDKNVGAPGAHEASQRVNLAHDTLSGAVREHYDILLRSEEQGYGPRSSGGGGGYAHNQDKGQSQAGNGQKNKAKHKKNKSPKFKKR